MLKAKGQRRSLNGTSLIEVLVVIVIFAIGILAMVQIFPGGLALMRKSQLAIAAQALAKHEIERLEGLNSRLPDYIVPVRYYINGSNLYLEQDENRRIDDLGPVAGSLTQDGILRDVADEPIGYWPLVSGANVARRVIGEGQRVPAPRQVGNFFGGLMAVAYGPIYFNEMIDQHLLVYGRDLTRVVGAPDDGELPEFDRYYVDQVDGADAVLFLPADDTENRRYRVVFSFYQTVGTETSKKGVLDGTVLVPPIGPGGGFAQIKLSDVQGVMVDGGATFTGVELDSIKVARTYQKIALADPFTDPYQYKLLDGTLGLLLFGEEAARTFERRDGRQVPLEARVSYDVLDWRVIRDDFRVPQGDIPLVKLALGNLKVKGGLDVDRTTYQGLNIQLPTGSAATERRDIVLMDLETGGILLEQSASRPDVAGGPKRLTRIDKSLGTVTFLDADDNPANGVTAEVVYPGTDTAVDLNITGRSFRALYQGVGEWAVQPLKTPGSYTQSLDRPKVTEFYIGDTGTPGGMPTRIYFPQSDFGRRVTVGEIWYRRGTDSTPRLIENQSFVVAGAADGANLPFIDVKALDPAAASLDFETYGYAVRNIKGASVSVRVLWNPSFLTLGADPVDNLKELDIWGREWRKTTLESFVRRTLE
jgi:type II secretory pathway pseudopilin PulG